MNCREGLKNSFSGKSTMWIASPDIFSTFCHIRRRIWAIFEIMILPDHIFYNVQFSETFSHAKVEAENGQPSLRVAATISVISLLSSSTSVIIVFHRWKPKAATTPAISIWLFHRIKSVFFSSKVISFPLHYSWLIASYLYMRGCWGPDLRSLHIHRRSQ